MSANTFAPLGDVLDTSGGGNVVVTVPWRTVANTNEGAVTNGTATYTIAISIQSANRLQALLSQLDQLAREGIAVVT